MDPLKHLQSPILRFASLLFLLSPAVSFGQQVIQRGPFNKPAQVLDETQQWTIPLLVSSDKEIEVYIADITATTWLSRNYPDFQNRGTYILSTFTRYKTVNACRANQISWGNGDAAHLDACNDIGYRVRQLKIDTGQRSVQLLMAAMIDQDGDLVPESIQDSSYFKTWDQLDATTQKAILKTNDLVTRQMQRYDAKVHNDPSPRRTVR